MSKCFGIFKSKEQLEQENKALQEQLLQEKRIKEEHERIERENKANAERERRKQELKDRQNGLYNVVKSFLSSSKYNCLHVQFNDNTNHYIEFNNILIDTNNRIYVQSYKEEFVSLHTFDKTVFHPYRLELTTCNVKAIEIIENKSQFSCISINGILYAPCPYDTEPQHTIENKDIKLSITNYLPYPNITPYVINNGFYYTTNTKHY